MTQNVQCGSHFEISSFWREPLEWHFGSRHFLDSAPSKTPIYNFIRFFPEVHDIDEKLHLALYYLLHFFPKKLEYTFFLGHPVVNFKKNILFLKCHRYNLLIGGWWKHAELKWMCDVSLHYILNAQYAQIIALSFN